MLHRLRCIFIITNLLLLFTFIDIADAKIATIDVDSMNVRNGPGTEYQIIHKLTKGATYEIIEESNNWYQIEINSETEGWIAGWLITISEKPSTNQVTATNLTNKVKVVESKITGLNVRTGPSTTFPVVQSISPEQYYEIIENNGEWSKIKLNTTTTGWVVNELVTFQEKEADSVMLERSVIVTADILNVRSEPNTSATVINKLKNGQTIKLLDVKDGWYKITFNEITGWIAADYTEEYSDNANNTIADGESTDNSELPPTNNTSHTNDINDKPIQQTAIVDVPILNVRSGPGTNHSSVGKLSQSDTVIILSQQDDWLKISYNGSEGWIANWHVSIQKENQSISQTPHVIIPKTGINIRSGPGTNYDIVTSTTEGDSFTIVNTHGEWYEILLPNSEKAFIAGWIVQVVGLDNTENNRSVEGLLKGKTIVIDPGHGGIDSGAIGSHFKTFEKEITLSTSLLLESKLKAAGANVIMTRTTDTFLSLAQRVSISVNNKADAFLSIHYNTNHSPSINGTIIYHYSNSGNDAKLARIVQQEVVNNTGLKNLNARQGNYYVLRENPQLAILVEAAFLSNYDNELVSKSRQFQEKVADGIFQGVLKYFNQ